MTAVPFDTLKLSRKLEAGGFTQGQANTAAEALADAMTGAELATKGDLKTEINSLRTELKADIELLRRDMTIRIGSMFVIAVGVLLAAMRFMMVG